MPSTLERLTTKFADLRARRPVVDHVVKTVQHYTEVNGNGQAGGVTVFGFLSFFPILALAFFCIGYVSRVYPRARQDLVSVLEELLPGVVGGGEGEIPLSTFEQNASTIGVIGLVGVLYAGLGWLSGMRLSLETMFKLPQREQPNFVVGKGRDLLVLALVGVVLLVSVGLSAAVAGLSEFLLGLVGLADSFVAQGLLWLLGHGLAIVATTVLLLVMFRLLAHPHEPRTALVHGALLGAVGFEFLKALANFLIGFTKQQPAFQAFGVALVLIVWIYYFSRLIMYSAAWAYTSPVAEEQRALGAVKMPGAALAALGAGPDAPAPDAPAPDASAPDAPAPDAGGPAVPVTSASGEPPTHRAPSGRGGRVAALVGGALVGLGVAAAVALRGHRSG